VVEPGEVANVATAAAVIVALVVGLTQIRQFNLKRREAAAMELVHTLQTPSFAHSASLVMALPDGADPQAILGDPAKVEAVHTLNFAFETLGVMVFHGILPLRIVDDIIGQFCQVSWRKAGPYFAHIRARDRTNGYGEWFQWLAERLAQSDRPEKKAGAHVAYRDWTP
jgi:hypothetical protein